MGYTAVLDIDDDRWAKHPYGITVNDEDGNVVERKNWLNSREECYGVSNKYGIDHEDIKENFY